MKINSQHLLVIVALAALFLAPATFAAKVYKWVDKDGSVHYSAQKPATSAQELKVKVKPASPAAEDDSAADTSASDTKKDAREDTIKVSSEKEAAEIEKKNAEVRKKNCSIAKKRVATINVGGRLYEVNEKGERSYWDDATRASKLAEAQAQVDEWCKD